MQKELLNLVKASYSFYYLAHVCHWYVTGPTFVEYHEFFGKIYEDIFAEIDRIAEYLRINNFLLPVSLKELLSSSELSGFDFTVSDFSLPGMINTLKTANDKMIDLFEDLYNSSTKLGKHSIENYAAERLDYHEKLGWMLSSILSESSVPTSTDVSTSLVKFRAFKPPSKM
jgi:starvation-inducible DNA-binding protein